MIREATQQDLSALVEMGEQFFAYSAFARYVEYDKDRAAEALAALIESPDAVVYVAELDAEVVGALIGVLSSAWFNATQRMAVELAWWMHPQHRHGTAGVRMLRAFETWAKAKGTQVTVMSDIVVEGAEPLGDMMQRAGYRYVERSSMRRSE